MLAYRLEHVFTYSVAIQPPEVLGPVPDDIRINFYVAEGKVWGPKCQGKLRPVGGDWMSLRRDGVGVLDVRVTIETDDGALLYVTYNGVVDFGADGHAQFLKGEIPDRMAVRAAPRIATAHPAYAWMNRCQFLAIGDVQPKAGTVTYEVYAVM